MLLEVRVLSPPAKAKALAACDTYAVVTKPSGSFLEFQSQISVMLCFYGHNKTDLAIHKKEEAFLCLTKLIFQTFLRAFNRGQAIKFGS